MTLAARFERVLMHRAWLPAWAALGCVLRLALVFAVGGALSFYDEHDYDRIARSLLAGEGFARSGVPTAFRPPAQPAFIALVYSVFGHAPSAVEIAQALLLGIIPFLVYRFGRSVSSEAGARVAAAVAALHPGIAYSSASLYPVALTTLAVTLGVVVALRALRDGSPGAALGAGLAMGMAGMCTTYFVPLPIGVAILAALRKRFLVALIIAGVGVLPAAIWTLRNDQVLGAPVLSTNAGYNLALGANDRATPTSGNWIEPDTPPAEQEGAELVRDRAWAAEAKAWIERHPTRWATVALGRAVAVFDSAGRPRTAGAHEGTVARVASASLLVLVVFGVIGLVLAWRRLETWLFGAALACVILSSAATIAKPRFRFPVDPLLGAFGVIPVERVIAWRKRRRRVTSLAADEHSVEEQPATERPTA